MTLLVTKQQIYDYLHPTLSELNPPVDLITVYPSNGDNVAYGVYINGVNTIERAPYRLGVQPCGSIYTYTDEFVILFVSFQNDPNAPFVDGAIERMVEDSAFWNGYHEVTFTEQTSFGARNKLNAFTILAKRLNFNNTATN